MTSGSSEEDRPRRASITYALDFEEVPTLKKIIKRIQGIDFSKRRSLDLACRRIQRAYEEKDAEGRLIDLMIAFEALFLKGEKRGGTFNWKIDCDCLLYPTREKRGRKRGY